MSQERRKSLPTAVTLALLAASILAGPGAGQPEGEKPERPQDWERLHYFIGRWQGTGTGLGGEAEVWHDYRFVLQDKFLHTTTRSVTAPQEDHPEGETHEDWGIFSFDAKRGKVVLRQFLTEGAVNQYVLETVSDDGKTLVFTTEAIEGYDPGWRARLTYRLVGDDEYEADLELGPPGKDFFGCRHMRMTRER